MITQEEYIRAKRIVQMYEGQLNYYSVNRCPYNDLDKSIWRYRQEYSDSLERFRLYGLPHCDPTSEGMWYRRKIIIDALLCKYKR
jgi:hypothetical protein